MKKSIIYIMLLAVISFMACDPIINRDEVGGEITADQLDISATLVMVNGKRANKVVVVNHSPVLSKWRCGLSSSVNQTDTLLLLLKGPNKVNFTGLNANGKLITKSITVDVEEMAFPVPPEFQFLLGNGKKTWVWDAVDNTTVVYGTAGYGNNYAPGWSTFKIGQEAGGKLIPGDEEMEFSLEDGPVFIRRKNNGTVIEQGSFMIDLTKKKMLSTGQSWNIGAMDFDGATIITGSSCWSTTPVYAFDVISLTDDKMVLAYAAAGTPFEAWNEATFWLFKAKK